MTSLIKTHAFRGDIRGYINIIDVKIGKMRLKVI